MILREDCARLRAQVDTITESRDCERVEKAAAVERARETKHQLEECETRASRLTLDLDSQRSANQKMQIEVADLRSRVQVNYFHPIYFCLLNRLYSLKVGSRPVFSFLLSGQIISRV